MKKTSRYIFTGVLIVFILVAMVHVARFAKAATSIELHNAKFKGPKDAPIHLIIYSDFQCPACRNAVVPLEELRTQFAKDLKVEFRHYPLERNHQWALLAATFAECAAEQNKFWEFHDLLYGNQDVWSRAQDPLSIFAGYVREVDLDTAQFERCIENPDTVKKIRKERSAGNRQGVQSTPTIFINGRALIGAIRLKQEGPGIVVEELAKRRRR